MSDHLLDGVGCPICLETLQVPIRMLPCGHNFCQSCLESLSTSSFKNGCPTCRRPFQLKNGIQSLPRNYGLETMIENVKIAEVANPDVPDSLQKESEVLTDEAVKELRDSSATYMKEKKFVEALPNLQTIINQADVPNKLLALFEIIKCYFHLGSVKHARANADDVCTLVASCSTSSKADLLKKDFSKELKTLIEELIKWKHSDKALSLVKSLLNLEKEIAHNETRIFRLQNIAFLIKKIAVELTLQEKKRSIKSYYSVLDEIQKEIQSADITHLKYKCKQAMLCLHYYGICCNYAGDWVKSIDILNQQKGLTGTVFGVEAQKMTLFGDCFYNLGNAYKNTSQIGQSKRCYLRALEIYNQASDWKNEELKQAALKRIKSVLLATK